MKRYEDFINGIKEDVEVPARVQARIDATLSELPVVEETGRRKEKRSWMSTAAAAILIIIALSGCAAAGVHFSKTRVHVVVTGSQNTGNMLQAEVEDFEKKYEEEHPDIDIVVERLLDDTTDWVEADIKKMRTDIMAGNGPDLYIMKGTLLATNEHSYLFPNVNKAMQSGVFASLDKYMKKDERWKTTNYMQKALEAGTYKGKQYVIPLEIQFPIFVQEKAKAVDYSQAKDLKECAEIAKNSNDTEVQDNFLGLQFEMQGMLLEPALDYENNQILMNKETFLDYAIFAQNAFYDTPFLEQATHSGLTRMYASAMASVPEKELDFQSVPGIDGKHTGFVTAYGAVGMNSTKKEVAYDFLASFMDKESVVYCENAPVNRERLQKLLKEKGIQEEAFLRCYDNIDEIVFLSEGSLLAEEKLDQLLQRNAPPPESDFAGKAGKMYDEIYRTYETILKE